MKYCLKTEISAVRDVGLGVAWKTADTRKNERIQNRHQYTDILA